MLMFEFVTCFEEKFGFIFFQNIRNGDCDNILHNSAVFATEYWKFISDLYIVNFVLLLSCTKGTVFAHNIFFILF